VRTLQGDVSGAVSATPHFGAAAPSPLVGSVPTTPAPEIASGTAPAQAEQASPPVGSKEVVWHGVRFRDDPQRFHFSETAPHDAQERAAASLIETPDPCLQFPNGADCFPNDVWLGLYSRDGLDFWAWLRQQKIVGASAPEGDFVDTMIGGRPAVAWPGDGIFAGDYLWYAVPLGEDVLLISGVGLVRFAPTIQFEHPGTAPLAAGYLLMTVPGRVWDLWSEPLGGVRVVERPQLYGGSLVTILGTDPQAVQVRTSEGVTGWIHAAAGDALAVESALPGEQMRFKPFSQAQIAHGRAIPLREHPRSTAPQRGELLESGQELTVLGVRGDWLRVYAPAGEGWVRWYYDDAQYIDVDDR
jgi:Bacterial SH3 domain